MSYVLLGATPLTPAQQRAQLDRLRAKRGAAPVKVTTVKLKARVDPLSCPPNASCKFVSSVDSIDPAGVATVVDPATGDTAEVAAPGMSTGKKLLLVGGAAVAAGAYWFTHR